MQWLFWGGDAEGVDVERLYALRLGGDVCAPLLWSGLRGGVLFFPCLCVVFASGVTP